MNIVQAFIKFNGKLIIIMSGVSGSGKTSIAKFIERDFKLVLINIDDYILENFDKTVTISNDIKVINWDDVDSYDWDKINKKVLDNQSNGVILTGPYFPTTKLKFDANFHIQIKVSKQILIEKRLKHAESVKQDNVKHLDPTLIPIIVNQITYPLYLKYSEESKIDKYVNSKELTKDKIYDQVADYLFFKINENLQEKHPNKKSSRIATDSAESAELLEPTESNSSNNTNSNKSKDDDSDSDSLNFDPENFDSSTSDDIADKTIKLLTPDPEPIFVGSDENPDAAEVDYWEYPKVGGRKY